MIDQKILTLQFERFKALNYFPTEQIPRDELLTALSSAKNEGVLVSVVNEWMKTKTERPTPADLYRMIRELADQAEPVEYFEIERPMFRCGSCQDSGMMGGTTVPWDFCSCSVGQRLQLESPAAVIDANAVLKKLHGKFPKLTGPSRFIAAAESVLKRIQS